MKRFVILVLVIMVLLTSVAFAEDYKSMSDDELLGILNSVRAELLVRDLSLSPEEVLIENDVVQMYLDKSKEVEFSDSGFLKIPVILISNSENVISFQVDSVMVNGWDCAGSVGNVSAAGKKRETLDINCKGAEIGSIEEIEDIRIALLAFNMDTMKRVITTDPITIVVENGQIVKE